MSRSRLLGAAVVVAGLAAGGGQAAAAGTVTVDRSCYSPGDPITETGAGFSPTAGVLEVLSLIRLSSSNPLASLQAPLVTTDSAGGFSRQLRAPKLVSARDREEIAMASFTDQALGDAAPLVTAQWTLSAWATEIPEWRKSVSAADPAKSMLVDTYGWTTAGKNVYAHYYRGTTFVKAVKLGALTGPCGNFKKRVKQFPFKKVQAGEWSVFISSSAILNKASDPWFRFKVRVPKAKARP
ncbi:MAG TPA: hypothetical protein VH395_16810 [Jatrophihabitantaceae bacterium]|jgi:hypothetical protein